MLKQLSYITALFFLLYQSKSLAQVLPDNSLGAESSTIRTMDELRDLIEGGAARGKNLFHSFEQFAIKEGRRIDFANPDGITNIFSRVTGGNISEILGTLGVDGSANLFLINPNGIVFGENAVIDVGGSFLATTAESIEFNSGNRFSATNPSTPNLTIDFPLGLFLDDPGDIIVRGNQNNIQLEIPSFRVITDNIPESIRVNSNESIALIGGNISFKGGGLKASQGNIDVISLDGNQTLRLISTDDWFVADLDSVSSFKDISFADAAYVDVSGELAGNINLSGRNISINEGSVIFADTSKPTNNSINISATDTLEIEGTSGNNELNVFRNNQGLPANAFANDSNFYSVSLVSADVLPEFEGQGTGNDINIDAKEIQIFDAGQIRTVSFSQFFNNRAGDINLEADDIVVKGTNNIDGFIGSVVNSTTGQGTLGNSGDVEIRTLSLKVEDGGRIKADTFSSGGGGRLNIASEEISLESESRADLISAVFRTGLSVSPGNKDGRGGVIKIESQELFISRAEINNSSFSDGIPGNITIDTEQLTILDGGAIRAETASGSSANISINAQNIVLDGTRPNIRDFVGGVSTSTRSNSQGDGGDININTESLEILNGSIIRAISLGSGDAGNINIETDRLEISGVDRFAENPIASERVSKINTGAIRGNGGDIIINSGFIELNDFGTINAISIAGDRGGNISLNVKNLELFGQSQISASAGNFGNGGNINIDAEAIIARGNSDITANAFQGSGGSVNINSDVILGIARRSSLTPFSDITADSELGIDGTVNISSLETDADDEIAVASFREVSTEIEFVENSCSGRNFIRDNRLIIDNSASEETPSSFIDYSDRYSAAIEEIKRSNTGSSSFIEPIVEPDSIVISADGTLQLVATNLYEVLSNYKSCS